MGRDLRYCILSNERYNDLIEDTDWRIDFDCWSSYDECRTLDFGYEGSLTRDELKNKAIEAVYEDDFRTARACAAILEEMGPDDICVYEND